MKKLTLGSLCSGYGGLDLAIEAEFDAETLWVSDIDPAACKILEARFPEAHNIGDMTTVDWSEVPPVDILSGGTPCQDLSSAGRRAGMTEGTRSNLWVSMREAISVIRPSLVVWENVRGALSAKATSDSDMGSGEGSMDTGQLRALGRVLGDLSDLGYDAEWTLIPASGVGAPHRRERVFVLAWPSADSGSLTNG